MNDDVEALQTAVSALENNDYVTDVEEVKEGDKVIGYTLTFAYSGKVTIYHGEKGDKGDKGDQGETGATGADGKTPTVEINGEGYWVINGVPTQYKAVGEKGDTGATGASGITPKFKIDNDKWYVSYDDGASWTEVGQATGNPGKDGDAFFAGVLECDINGKPINADNDNLGSDVAYIYLKTSETTGYKIPTQWLIEQLIDRIEALESSVGTLKSLFQNNTFIKSITPKYENSNNTGRMIGFEVITVTVNDDLSFTVSEPLYYGNNGTVIPYKVGDSWYFKVLVGFDEISGAPIYEQIASSAEPKFICHNGDLYMSTDPSAVHPATDSPEIVWTKIAALPYLAESGSGSYLDTITHQDDRVVLRFYNGNIPTDLEIPKFYEKPVITFGTERVTLGKDDTSADVTFTITGSFTKVPEVYAICDGGWTSEISEGPTLSDDQTTVVGEITVSPTSAYVGNNYNGKLTLYVQYYNSTAMKQLPLSAEGNVVFDQELSTTSSSAGTLSFSFDTDMISESGKPRLGYSYGEDFAWIHTGEVTTSEGKNGLTRFTQTIKLDMNTARGDRDGVIIVYAPSGRELQRIKVSQPGSSDIINLADPEDNGNVESANCYIITKDGRYMIPAYKGNNSDGSGLISGIVSKKSDESITIWTDNGTTIKPVDGAPDEMLLFDVSDIQAGNTVIAATDESGKILWSWHLWFCPGGVPGDDTFGSYAMMDRNLGAAAPIKRTVLDVVEYIPQQGAFYQWGRKDPFFGDTQAVANDSNVSMETATQNPTTFYSNWDPEADSWSSSKSEYDPCPPGYKIPNGFELSVEMEEVDLSSAGDFMKISDGNFPINSYIVNTTGQKETFASNTESEVLSKYEYKYGFSGSISYWDITYEVTVKKQHGDIWISTKGLKDVYNHLHTTYNDIIDLKCTSSDVLDYLKDGLKRSVSSDLKAKYPQDNVNVQIGTTTNCANGLQVRCVRETE